MPESKVNLLITAYLRKSNRRADEPTVGIVGIISIQNSASTLRTPVSTHRTCYIGAPTCNTITEPGQSPLDRHRSLPTLIYAISPAEVCCKYGKVTFIHHIIVIKISTRIIVVITRDGAKGIRKESQI